MNMNCILRKWRTLDANDLASVLNNEISFAGSKLIYPSNKEKLSEHLDSLPFGRYN